MAYYEETTTKTETHEWFSGINYPDDNDDNMYFAAYGAHWGDANWNGRDSKGAEFILLGDDDWWDTVTTPDMTTPAMYPYGTLDSLWWANDSGNLDANWDPILDANDTREEVWLDLTKVNGIYPVIDLYDYQYRVVVERTPQPIVWYGGVYNDTEYYLYDPYDGGTCDWYNAQIGGGVTYDDWDPHMAERIKFLGYYYDLLYWGKNTTPWSSHYGDYYAVYGTPYWSDDSCRQDNRNFDDYEYYFEVGETKNFHGWEVTLKDVNIYENKAKWLIKGPDDEEPCEYFVSVSKYDPDVDPDEPGNAEDRCFAAVQGKACEYDVIGVTKKLCGDYPLTVFALDTVKLFVGADGTNEAAAVLYAVEDYGVIHDAV